MTDFFKDIVSCLFDISSLMIFMKLASRIFVECKNTSITKNKYIIFTIAMLIFFKFVAPILGIDASIAPVAFLVMCEFYILLFGELNFNKLLITSVTYYSTYYFAVKSINNLYFSTSTSILIYCTFYTIALGLVYFIFFKWSRILKNIFHKYLFTKSESIVLMSCSAVSFGAITFFDSLWALGVAAIVQLVMLGFCLSIINKRKKMDEEIKRLDGEIKKLDKEIKQRDELLKQKDEELKQLIKIERQLDRKNAKLRKKYPQLLVKDTNVKRKSIPWVAKYAVLEEMRNQLEENSKKSNLRKLRL